MPCWLPLRERELGGTPGSFFHLLPGTGQWQRGLPASTNPAANPHPAATPQSGRPSPRGKGAVALGKTSGQDGQALTGWARTAPCSSGTNSSRAEVHGGGRALRAGRGTGTHLCTCPDGWGSGGREQLPAPLGTLWVGTPSGGAAVPTPGG